MVEKVFDRAQRGTHSVDGCVAKLSRLCGITSTSTAVWAAAEECFLKALAPLAAAASQQHQRRKSSSLLPSPASVGLSRGRRAVVAVFAGFALAAGRGAHAAKFVAGLCGCAQPIVREWCCFALSCLCPLSLAEAAEQEEGAESGLLFVEDALMLRARDKATSVRVQCVLAAAVWQRRSVLLEDMLGTLAATDSSQEVRIAALRALRCGSGTPALLRVVERTRDVSEAVRKEAFVKLRHELPSISGVPNDAGQREALLHDGLNDRCDAVRGACSDLLLSWLAGEQNCPISLLSHLDFAESEELAVQVSKEIIQRALDTVLAVLSTKPPLQKGVLPSDEGALFARCLAECGHAPPQSLLLIGPHSGVTLQEIIASARDAQRDFVLQQLLHMAISSASSITAASLRAELSFFCMLLLERSELSERSLGLVIAFLWKLCDSNTHEFVRRTIGATSTEQADRQSLVWQEPRDGLLHRLFIVETALSHLDPKVCTGDEQLQPTFERLSADFVLPCTSHHDEAVRKRALTCLGLADVLCHSAQHASVFSKALESEVDEGIRAIAAKCCLDLALLHGPDNTLSKESSGAFIVGLLRSGVDELCTVAVEGAAKLIATGTLEHSQEDADDGLDDEDDEVPLMGLLLVLFFVGPPKQKQSISALLNAWSSESPSRCRDTVGLAVVPALRCFVRIAEEAQCKDDGDTDSAPLREAQRLVTFVARFIGDTSGEEEHENTRGLRFLHWTAQTRGERAMAALCAEMLSGERSELALVSHAVSTAAHALLPSSTRSLGAVIEHLLSEAKKRGAPSSAIDAISRVVSGHSCPTLGVEDLATIDALISAQRQHLDPASMVEQVSDSESLEESKGIVLRPRVQHHESFSATVLVSDADVADFGGEDDIVAPPPPTRPRTSQPMILLLAKADPSLLESAEQLGATIETRARKFHSNFTHVVVPDDSPILMRCSHNGEEEEEAAEGSLQISVRDSFFVCAALLLGRWVVPLRWLRECVKKKARRCWSAGGESNAGGLLKMQQQQSTRPLQGTIVHIDPSFAESVGGESAVAAIAKMLSRGGGVSLVPTPATANIVLVGSGGASSSINNDSCMAAECLTWPQFFWRLHHAASIRNFQTS